MKKVTIEGKTGYKLFVENTPTQDDKTINVFGFEQFNFFNESWASQHDRFILTIDEGGGSISLIIVRSKVGNGYVGRELESGEHKTGRIFDIVSPVYYIESPERGTSSSSKTIKTFEINNPNKCMFFPSPVGKVTATLNFYEIPDSHSVNYGKCFGVAGKSYFYQTISYELDPDIDGVTLMDIQNKDKANNTNVSYIGGEYKIL